MPFLAQSDDLGGFRELIAPGAFNKTLQESRELAALVHPDRAGVRFGASPVSVSFQVIQERWLQGRESGALLRELIEIRLVSVSVPETQTKISAKARAIATGARRDFIAGRRKRVKNGYAG